MLARDIADHTGVYWSFKVSQTEDYRWSDERVDKWYFRECIDSVSKFEWKIIASGAKMYSSESKKQQMVKKTKRKQQTTSNKVVGSLL